MKMKFLVVFVSLVVMTVCSEQKLWIQFKENYSKSYKSLEEEEMRFQIFKDNLYLFKTHNDKYEKEEVSYFLGINQFSDLSNEEFTNLYLNFQKPEMKYKNLYEVPDNYTPPESIDWRSKGAVLSVRDLGNCTGGWYAFSAIDALEGQYYIKDGIRVELSEQEIIDCTIDYLNNGCISGMLATTLEYIQYNGIASATTYPYVGIKKMCQKNNRQRSSVNVTDVQYVIGEDRLQAAVASVGPISVYFNAYALQSYKGGIFDDSSCSLTQNYGGLVVGYGSENSKEYWIVKLAFGTTWGENGYIRMSRNKNNQCGIGSEGVWPEIS